MATPDAVDWSDHAVSIAAMLATVTAVLGGICVRLIRAGMQRRDQEITESLAGVREEIKSLRADVQQERAEIFERLRAAEVLLAEQRTRCEAYHTRREPWSQEHRRQVLGGVNG